MMIYAQTGWLAPERPAELRLRRGPCVLDDVYTCIYIYIYIHIFTHREREREREMYVYMYVCVYVYIYIDHAAFRALGLFGGGRAARAG